MKLENQVVSLELARQLKNLGVEQESLFWWNNSYQDMKGDASASAWEISYAPPQSKTLRRYAAFTVAELGEMLPSKSENWQTAQYETGIWFITNHQNTLKAGEARTEADARGKLLIYLIENKLLTL
jgi:hypothetical protein